MNDRIPEKVRLFIRDYIQSVEQLEILLLLYQHPDKEWTPNAVSKEIRSTPISTAKRLSDLKAARLVDEKSGSEKVYTYRPATAELSKQIAELADTYATMRVTVIDLIFSKPVDKIRTFADAFKLREDKD